MAHDFLGNELSIGDYVVFLNYNVTSASLESGIITRVSEHTAEISGKRRAEYKIVKVNPVKSTMDNTWIPCSERLPGTNGKDVSCLAYIPSFGAVDIADYHPDVDEWTFMCLPVTVTHWMPLPEPPEEGGAWNAAN